MRRKRWMILILIVSLAAGVFCLREAVIVRLFPKTVLTNAIANVFAQMQTRFADSPAQLLSKALDPSGSQKIRMKLDASTQFMGIAHYDLELQTRARPNRITGQGTIATGAGIMDLKLYIHEDFGALSSDSLTQGLWYGITYDSFPEDIRSFRLLDLFLGEDILDSWETAVANFSRGMRRDYRLPEIGVQDARAALQGALALKPQVRREEGKHAYSIAFACQGRELAEKVTPYLQAAPESLAKLVRAMEADPDSRLKLIFHLEKRELTALDVSLILSGISCDGRLAWEGNQLRGELLRLDGENLERTELTLDTVSDEEIYREKLLLTRTANGVQSRVSADYTWDLSSGDLVMDLRKDGRKYPIRLNLQGDGESVTVFCQEFEVILSLLTGKDKKFATICALTVSPGDSVDEIPEYKNLNEWSVEDFYLLLTRIGSLIGIKIP